MTAKNRKPSEKSLVGGFKWEDVLIPTHAGSGLVKVHHQNRTLLQYFFLAVAGLTAFYKSEIPQLRAAGLGLLFPGAGFMTKLDLTHFLGLLISLAATPVALFAWFGCGGIAFPIFLWTSSTAIAALSTNGSVLEWSAPAALTVCAGVGGILAWRTKNAKSYALGLREKRNSYLLDAVQKNQENAVEPEPGSREVDERTLRFVQWFIELGLADKDDWSYHDMIDQFQTAAVRYQLTGAISELGIYQFIYAPNFHGYLAQAQRNVIDKLVSEQSVGFWKWESMLGKFKFSDWDPIKKDDIMVSGYVLQAIGIYQSNTGDTRYTKKDCLEFIISEKAKYKYDMQSIAEAVYQNMDENPYCLYPCEPNWIYTLCNLVGIGGLLISDRLLGNNYSEKLRSTFETSLEKEFTTPSGTILPIRSELTGFTIPGLAGILSDAANSVLCAAYLPHIAHRNWAFTKQEAIKYDEKGKVKIVNLVGADRLDPGNYKSGEGCIRSIFAPAAAEFGDEELCRELLRQLDEEYHPVYTTKTGALRNKGISTTQQGSALRARLASYQDWRKMITVGPTEANLRGPILNSVSFPDVLVAKAYSHDGEALDLVFYDGKKAGTFPLGFERLRPNKAYKLGNQTSVADKNGKATFSLKIDGRTAVELKPIIA